ncbi:MAG: hypothetical protein R3320_02615 [Nitriliruptorales bacterium]|nr:hypothetical protein [Nitriliruptorales bacterium]
MENDERAPQEQGRGGSDDLVLIQHMLRLTPEQRLLGLVRAAQFFNAAKRV